MANFPATPEQLTAEFLSTVLAEQNPSSPPVVSEFRVQPIVEQGAMSTGVRIELTYEPGAPGPGALYAKYPAQSQEAREASIRQGTYRREVRFYRELASDPALTVPRPYFAEYAAETGDFLLLLEDMGQSRVGSYISSAPDDVASVLEPLAVLHARWWRSPELSELRWIAPVDHPAVVGAIKAVLSDGLPTIRERFSPWYDGLLGEATQRLAKSYAGVAAQFAAAPQTIVHGDLHLQNVFLPTRDGGRFAIFDWQSLGQGAAGQDLARVIAFCLDTDDRRANERAFVEQYHRALNEQGVTDYDLGRCWDDYRLGLLWSVVINGMAAVSAEVEPLRPLAKDAGTTIEQVLFGRLEAALDDLDALELVGGP